MKRIFILGLLLVTWAVLLIAGCGGDEKQEAATQVAADDGSKKTLNIYMWPDIVDPKLIEAFEKQNNCRINYDVISNNEELLAKMQAGGAQYDLIQPSDYMVEIMIKLKMLDKLNQDNIPNKKHLVPFLQKPAYDPTGEYVVPYTWGFTGIVYNKKYVKKEYVKLLMATDPLKIRMRTNAMLQTTPDTIEDRQLVAVFLTLYDQILENHKIINFNSPQKVATQTAFIKEDNYLNWLLDGPAKRVLNMTDGVWKKYEDKCKEERIQQIINKAQAKAQEKEAEEPQMDNND